MNIIRYGVETASFTKMLAALMKILRFIELDITKKWTYIGILKAFLWFTPSLFFYVADLWSVFIESDLKMVGEFLFVVSGVIINIIPKIVTYLLLADKLKILHDMVVCNTTDLYTKTADEQIILRRYTTIARITTNTLQLSFVFAFIILHILPYLANFVRPTWYLPLKFQIFGLSNTSHPGYDIHFLLIHVMVVYTLILITSDLLFFYYTLYIAFRYDLIQQLVGKLGNLETEFDTPEKQSSLLEKILILHSDNMRFCRVCSDTYSLIVLFQAANFMLTVVISLTIFGLNPLLSVLGIQVTGAQFLIFCVFGEMVNTKRIETSNAIYCSYWYKTRNVSDLKKILFLLKNSQTDISFTAYGLFRLSLETYVKILRAAFSYFTFIESVI